jgi:hypothetical protein
VLCQVPIAEVALGGWGASQALVWSRRQLKLRNHSNRYWQQNATCYASYCRGGDGLDWQGNATPRIAPNAMRRNASPRIAPSLSPHEGRLGGSAYLAGNATKLCDKHLRFKTVPRVAVASVSAGKVP